VLNHWIWLASFYGASGVVLGAFGAHGLSSRLSPDRLATWETGVQYHLLHAVALLALALAHRSDDRSVAVPAGAFGLGIALFSGSIYGLVLTDWRWLGPVTPIGGVCLIVGWIALIPLARAQKGATAGRSS
jgi:uncharacterized membrane protein YgdD (TMEM256/DUF423 family)